MNDNSNTVNPYQLFPQFYSNSMIQDLMSTPKWTFSMPDTKMPIDIGDYRDRDKLRGCQKYPSSTVTLPELLNLIPNIINHTFMLDCERDGYVCLDIEPKCPDEIKEKLLHLPYIYGEYSMSGKGYHLFFKEPDCIQNYPDAQNKIVLKEEHRWYEILRIHAVTFTRKSLPKSDGSESFDELYEELCKQAKPATTSTFDVSTEKPDIPLFDDICENIYGSVKPYAKTIDDFNGDFSSFEFGFFSYMYDKLNLLLNNAAKYKDYDYDKNMRMWLLYLITEDHYPFEHRPKHDEVRFGLPWLMYLCREVVSKYVDPREKKKKD